MALPSKPTTASNMGEIHRDVEMVASSPTSNHGPDMGSVTTSHIGGGAVWWKSPSTALVRGRDGQPPDLLYNTFNLSGVRHESVSLFYARGLSRDKRQSRNGLHRSQSHSS